MARNLTAPIPTKFSREELAFIDEVKRRTGLSRSEIIRRAVAHLHHEAQKAPNLHAFLGSIAEARIEEEAMTLMAAESKRAYGQPKSPATPKRSSRGGRAASSLPKHPPAPESAG